VSKFKTAQERINLITQILEHIGRKTKRALAVQYLEQAKNLDYDVGARRGRATDGHAPADRPQRSEEIDATRAFRSSTPDRSI
jgi:hypothetical protein